MKDYQTPQKEQSRPSDFAKCRSKDSQLNKSQKVTKKSLNAAFRSVSEDLSPDITKEPVHCSPISEVFDANFKGDIGGSFALNPSPSASLESELSDLSLDHHRFIESNGSKIGSVEADILAKLLEEAGSQVLNSVDVNAESKKLLDSLIKLVVDEFYTIPVERDRVTELVLMKSRIAFTCFLIWILAALLIFFFSSGPQRSYMGALPT